MRVKLIAHTVINEWVPGYLPNEEEWSVTDADRLAEMGGRLCYLAWYRKNPLTRTIWGYLKNIITKRHFSVLEHASATFYIDGVTRNFTHELIRHRHLSFSEVSQRYVDVSEFPFVWHPGLLELTDEEERDNFLEDGLRLLRGDYEYVMEKAQARGIDRKSGRQAARHVLPGGMETKILVTGNMRAWREVLEKRLSPEADAEFRAVAQEILNHLRVIAPATFQDFDEVETLSAEERGIEDGGLQEAA